ncbi:MAG: 2-dehydropantoate 2-reductase [Candidatus Heimdallarchaeota archaeon]|nr:MAG: 2-dehydropantoate 2-reductase [Candidatus Heimdallarchaeota archaeon]
MNIIVFGAGSIGSLFAGRIAYSGFDVSVVGRNPHVTEINKKGLRILEDQEELLSHFPARTSFHSEVVAPEAIFVTTKAYDNGVVANNMAGRISNETPIFVLQNGMGNERVFYKHLPQNPIFRAITTEAAELIYPGIVKHVAFGKTSFGIITGQENGFGQRIQNIMRKSGFNTKKTTKIQLKMWQKLLTNATICPLGALLHVPNGNILQKPSIKRIFEEILKEGLAVATHNLPDEDFSLTHEFILKVMGKTKDNRCSMLQDIERGRKTEIDYINGFIVQESRRLGLKAPVNAAIADLIRHLEQYPQ